MTTHFGLTLPNRGVLFDVTTAEQLLALAELADNSEYFDSVWVGDSLFAKPRLDALTLLAAIAARTKRIQFGPACFASFTLRQPLVLAYEWASLDIIGQGRSIMVACTGGAGNGDWAQEARALGIPNQQRLKRLVEGIELMKRVWTDDHVNFSGTFHTFEDVTMLPKPTAKPHPPIWIASNPHTVGGGPEVVERSLRRIARVADGWMTHSVPPEEFARRWERIRGYAVEYGRDPDALQSALYHNINVNEDRDAALAESKKFLDLYYTANFTRDRIEAWEALGSVEQCVENLQGYADVGVHHILLRATSWDQQGQLDRVLKEVLPKVRR